MGDSLGDSLVTFFVFFGNGKFIENIIKITSNIPNGTSLQVRDKNQTTTETKPTKGGNKKTERGGGEPKPCNEENRKEPKRNKNRTEQKGQKAKGNKRRGRRGEGTSPATSQPEKTTKKRSRKGGRGERTGNERGRREGAREMNECMYVNG